MSTSQHPSALPSDELLRHASWLHALARSLVLDDAEADDLVQETWLRALGADRTGLRDPRGWLAGVARNVARNRGRSQTARRARERSVARPEAPPDAPDGAELLERHRALLARVEALEEPCRSAVLARYFEGLPPRAIARREGVGVATVKSRLARALERLRRDLDGEHGDRRAWGLYLLPLARTGGRSALASSAPLAVASLVTLLIAATAVTLSLRGGSSTAPPLAQPPSPVESAAAPASEGVVDLSGQDGSGERRVVSSTSELIVRVVDDATGAPVADALVRYLDGERIERLGERLQESWWDPEGSLAALGGEARTDSGGTVHLSGHAPWIVRASQGARLGAGGGETDMDELELRLVPVPLVSVSVVDTKGAPAPGVTVGGTFSVSDTVPGREPDTWGVDRVTDDSGIATFLDPFWYWLQEPAAREGHEAFLSSFRIDVPGAPEIEPAASATTRVGEDRAGRESNVRLVLPPTGALELIAVDGSGAVVAVNGRASVATLDAPWQPYDTELVGGRARFPRVALGLRLRATLSVPTLGASWTAVGEGPRTEGAETTIRIVRPSSRVWTATIVDESGAPVAGARADLYLDDAGSRFGPRQIGPLVTSAQGELRAELPDDARPRGGFYIELRHALQLGWVEGSVDGDPARAEVDLGRHTARFGPLQSIRGRCVDASGSPVSGVTVYARPRSGIQHAADSGADGSFELSGLFGEQVPLDIQDRSAIWIGPATPPIAVPDGDPLVVVLTPGSTLEARLGLPEGSGSTPGGYAVLKADGLERPAFASLTPSGELRWSGLVPGTYRFELYLQGDAPLVVVPEVRIGPGENRDGRIDAIDLGTLLRPVQVVALDPEGQLVRAELVVADDEHLLNHESAGRGTILVPTTPGWSLFVATAGWRVQPLGEVTELADEIEVRLLPGLEVELVPHGGPLGPGDWQLRREGPLARLAPIVQVPEAVVNGEPALVRFSAPGTWRLFHQVSSPSTGGTVVTGLLETSVEIEVREADGRQRIEIDLAAAASK